MSDVEQAIKRLSNVDPAAELLKMSESDLDGAFERVSRRAMTHSRARVWTRSRIAKWGALGLIGVAAAGGGVVIADENSVSPQEAALLAQAAQRAETKKQLRGLELVKAPPNYIASMSKEKRAEAVQRCEQSGSGDLICRVHIQVQQGDMEPGYYPNKRLSQLLRAAEADG